MITRPVALLTGLTLLAAVGTAQAHQESRYVVQPANLAGTVTVWGGSHGPSGWAGSLSLGAPLAIGTAVVPVAAVPPPHWHGPRCGHVYQTVVHEYAQPWRADYGKGRKHHRGRGHGHGHHH